MKGLAIGNLLENGAVLMLALAWLAMSRSA